MILLLAGLLLPVVASAQTRDSLTVNPFFSNWSLRGTYGFNRLSPTAGVGSGRLAPGYDLVIGKAFSPHGGARLGLQGGGLTMWGSSPRFRRFSAPLPRATLPRPRPLNFKLSTRNRP